MRNSRLSKQFLQENYRENNNYYLANVLEKIRFGNDSRVRRCRVQGQLSFPTTCVQFILAQAKFYVNYQDVFLVPNPEGSVRISDSTAKGTKGRCKQTCWLYIRTYMCVKHLMQTSNFKLLLNSNHGPTGGIYIQHV